MLVVVVVIVRAAAARDPRDDGGGVLLSCWCWRLAPLRAELVGGDAVEVATLVAAPAPPRSRACCRRGCTEGSGGGTGIAKRGTTMPFRTLLLSPRALEYPVTL